MNREQVRNIIFDKITDWTPYADAIDERIAQERTDELLDAILPQVTTVEELITMEDGSLLLDTDGRPWKKCGWRWQTWARKMITVGELTQLGPLMVVWQP